MPDVTDLPMPDPTRAFPAPEAVDSKRSHAGRTRLRLSTAPTKAGLEGARATVTSRLRAFGATPADVTIDGDTLVVTWTRGNVPGAVAAVAAAPGHFSIRPVLDDRTGRCQDPTGGDGEDVSLPGTEDGRPHCYRLGAAALDRPTVVAASATTFTGQPWVVDVQLDSQAAADFDTAAARSFGQRLALVIDGTVVSAPTVQAQRFEGRIQISGRELDELEARRLAGLLAGGALPITLRAGPLEHP